MARGVIRSTQSKRGIIALLAALTALSCDAGKNNGQSEGKAAGWPVVGDSNEVLTLSEESPCLDCIMLERIVVAGDTTPRASVDYASSATIDSIGRFWFAQKGHVKVFAASGKLEAVVGRAGNGPMEFIRPFPLHTDVRGRVHLFDPPNLRETIVDTTLALVAERRLATPSPFSLAVMSDGDRYVVSAWITDEKSLGFNLHVMRADTVLASFGSPRDGMATVGINSQRHVAVDADDRVFSAMRFAYEIEVFSDAGRRVLGVSGPRLNAQLPSSPIHNVGDNPLPNEITSIRVDGGGRLWVLSRRVRDGWRRFFVDRIFPDGSLGMTTKPGVPFSPDSVFFTRIEVIDLSRGRVVARHDGGPLLNAMVGDEVFLENREDTDGTPRLALWRGKVRNP